MSRSEEGITLQVQGTRGGHTHYARKRTLRGENRSRFPNRSAAEQSGLDKNGCRGCARRLPGASQQDPISLRSANSPNNGNELTGPARRIVTIARRTGLNRRSEKHALRPAPFNPSCGYWSERYRAAHAHRNPSPFAEAALAPASAAAPPRCLANAPIVDLERHDVAVTSGERQTAIARPGRLCSAYRSGTRLLRFRSGCRLPANRVASARVLSCSKAPVSKPLGWSCCANSRSKNAWHMVCSTSEVTIYKSKFVRTPCSELEVSCRHSTSQA
ncbi:hypothetical protein ABIF61_006988 [Bradyrhizobium japonicum]